MRYMRFLLAIEAIAFSLILVYLAFEYSFGSGYGLHPLLSGIGVGLAWAAWNWLDGLVGGLQRDGLLRL